jgi:hypothetical protein
MRRTLLLALIGLIGLLVVGTSQAFAVNRWVNDNDPNGGGYAPPGTSCNNPGYATIEGAVNSSGPGDRVNVCPGTYPEQVSVEPGKNNLTIRSVTPLAAVIQAPPTIAADVVNFQSIVRITTSTNVTLTGFRVTGPGPHGCNSIRFGVRVDGGGSANILSNHITEIRDTPFSGCQNGVAIQVGRQADGTTGRANIIGNRIDRYQKNGPTVDNAGSSAVIRHNLMQGVGPTLIIAQNGIQVSRGATAQVDHNLVRDHIYIVPLNLPEFTATGILIFGAASTTDVEENNLRNNQDGIGIFTTTSARFVDNHIIGAGGTVPPPTGTLTLGDGIYASSDTANNLIRGNFIRNNVEHDCHDDSIGPGTAGTANFWIDNDGLTSQPPGLCQPRDDEECLDDDEDNDGLTDERELLLFTLLANPDSDMDGIKDGNDDSNGNGEDDEDEDDDDDPCPNDSDHDGEDDEDEDDDDDDD